MISFDRTMQGIAEGVFPSYPAEAKVIFVNIAHAMYPGNNNFAYRATDQMIRYYNAKTVTAGLPKIQT